MKRTVIAALTLFIAIAAIGCGAKKDDNLDIIGGADGPTSIFLASKSKEDKALSWLYEKCGVNVIWGDKIYSNDTHGGFHGDGSSLYSYQFTDSSMEPEMEESEYWKSIPLSEEVSNLINNSIGDECAEAIPEIPNGYYFFYDRHTEAADPYDESELWNRASINCTVALYDADEDILYIFMKDT